MCERSAELSCTRKTGFYFCRDVTRSARQVFLRLEKQKNGFVDPVPELRLRSCELRPEINIATLSQAVR